MLLLLAASCQTVTCGPGTVLTDDVCLPETVAPTTGPTDTDPDTTGDTGTVPDCIPVDVWEVTATNDPALVNQSWIEVLLDGISTVDVVCTLTTGPAGWLTLLPSGSTWRYLDSGVAPAEGWQEPGFDDSGWAEGISPLGYGDAPATTVSFGDDDANKHVTTWFRGTVSLSDVASLTEARLLVTRDDGVIVSLNGVEVLRNNIADGEVDAGTLALFTTSGSDESTPVEVLLDLGLLVEGDNSLAVEVHQASIDSSDMRFDLTLEASVPGEPISDGEVHVLSATEPAPYHELLLQGLIADSVYTCEAATDCPAESRSSFTVRTGELPDRLPSLDVGVAATDAAYGDYTLLNHGRPCSGDNQNQLLIVDHDGNVRWYFELDGLDQSSTIDLEPQYLGDGRIAWGGGDRSEGSPQIVDLSGQILYQAAYPGAEDDVYHHDIEVTPEGRILGLINTDDVAGPLEFEGFAIIEHDPVTLEVTWSWFSQDALDAGQLAASGSRDPWHANSLAAVDDADGRGVYVSLLTTNEIIRIDRETGDVSWHLGEDGDFAVVDADGEPLEDGWFTGLHAIDVTSTDSLMVYDNGQGPDKSRAVEYALDTANKVATLAWSYAEPDWYEPIWGDADELPNGNRLINMAHAWCYGGTSDHWGSLVEVDPADNSQVWRVDFTSADDSSYRSQKLDGCEIFNNATACPERLP